MQCSSNRAETGRDEPSHSEFLTQKPNMTALPLRLHVAAAVQGEDRRDGGGAAVSCHEKGPEVQKFHSSMPT